MLSAAALLVVALITIDLYRNPIPSLPGGQPPSPSRPPTAEAVARTASPSLAAVATPAAGSLPGSMAYVKGSNLWIRTGTRATQLTFSTAGSRVSQPAWSADGRWLYYVDTRVKNASWYNPDDGGAISHFTLNYPVLCRIRPDGSGRQDVLSSLVKSGSLESFYWIRQPSIAPDGSAAVVVSDGPSGPGLVGAGDTVLHLVDLATGKLGAALPLPENPPLGHSDPTYSADGTKIAYVMEGRDGAQGAPQIWIYDLRTGKERLLAEDARGPSWSPDGKYLAATLVDGSRLDIVVLDAATGAQVGRVTYDGFSWAPVWSPEGDQLVYLHLTSTVVEMFMTEVNRSDAGFDFQPGLDLTDYGSLDGDSRPAWYVGGSESAPSPSPADSALASASAS